MFIDVPVCPECRKELSDNTVTCHHCGKSVSRPMQNTIFSWLWLDRFFLLSTVLVLTCFFMPWFPGEYLSQDSGFSAYKMLAALVDLDVEFLDSYNILRMVQIVPLFTVLIFFLIYLQDNLKTTPFPGIFLFICILTGMLIYIFQKMSGPMAWISAIVFTAALLYYFRRGMARGDIGRISHYVLIEFLSLSVLFYLFDLYQAFYARLNPVVSLDIWGFQACLIIFFIMSVLIILKNMRGIEEFWLLVFVLGFSIIAYSTMVKPLFFSGPFAFFADNINETQKQLVAHIRIVAISLGIAVAVGVPVGVYITRHPAVAGVVLYFSSILITIPSIAMFGFMMPILSSIDNAWDAVSGIGIGVVPAVVALSLYSLLPIIRNTFIALKSVDPATIEAGRGMGMTNFQLLIQLQLPLAAPIIMAGVRTAMVMGIAIAAIAAYIGAGGLGVFVSEGLQMSTNASVIAGAMAMSVLAIIADLFLGKAEEWLTPTGLKIRQT